MKQINPIFYLLCLSLANTSVFAEKKEVAESKEDVTTIEKPPIIEGNISLGINSSSGNAETNGTNATLNLTYNTIPWRHEVFGEFIKLDVSGETIVENTTLLYNPRYYLGGGQKHYIFGFLSYEQDDFSNIKNRYTEAAGYGKHIFKNDKHNLGVEIGTGLRQTSHTDGSTDDKGGIGYLGLYYSQQLNDRVSINQTLQYFPSKENTYTTSDTSLMIEMTKKLSLSLTYNIDKNSVVADGFKNTDTRTGTNLVYNF